MTPERWQRVNELFERAAVTPAERRAAELDQACGQDASLRAEVESLLASDARAAGFLRNATNTPNLDWSPAPPEDMTGRTIGAYRVNKRLASGGMGTVWLAERADRQFEKQVAIKLIKRGMDSDEILRRFSTERRVLAGMEHANIARLIDGGVADDGRPYLVLEYVQGVAIDRYCDEKRLSIRERLELFRAVCAAVQFAHQNLVIHRDLKPGNILVTADGTPKLLDFGIAKVVGGDGASAGQSFTAVDKRPMTPEYASPEQIRGEPMTTATDVYSLGVVLYELLTGHRPFSTTGNASSIVQDICDREPERPSTVVTRPATNADSSRIEPFTVSEARRIDPKRLRRALSGDLDTIVLMSLRKEQGRRYATVEQLSEDIRRHLAGLPVTARPDTLGYRAGKFASRHRAGVAAALLFMVGLAGWAVNNAVQNKRILDASVAVHQAEIAARSEATKARNAEQLAHASAEKATRAASRAERTVKFLSDMLAAGDPYEKGPNTPVRVLLDQAAKDAEHELADDPEVLAATLATIGETYRALGLPTLAEPHLQAAFETRLRLLGENHRDTAHSRMALGLLRLEQNKLDEAESLLEKSVVQYREITGADSAEYGDALANYGQFLADRARYDEAELAFRQAVSTLETALGAAADTTLVATNNLANLCVILDKTQEAEQLLTTVLEARRAAKDEPRTADALCNLGQLVKRLGRYDEAEGMLREAVTTWRKSLGPDHPNLAVALNNLGMLLYEKHDFAAGRPLLEEGLAINRKAFGEEHLAVANLRSNLGMLLHDSGQYADAEREYRAALNIRRKLLGAEHPTIARSLNNVASVLQDLGRLDESETLYRESIAMRRKTLGKGHPDVAVSLNNLGSLLVEKGDFAGSIKAYRQSLKIRRASLGDTHPVTASTMSNLAAALSHTQEWTEAETLLRDALKVQRETLPPKHPSLAETLLALGVTLNASKNYAEAVPVLDEAMKIVVELLPPDNKHRLEAETSLGRALRELKRFDEAEAPLKAAYDALSTANPKDAQAMADAASDLALLYRAWGKADEEKQYLQAYAAATQPTSSEEGHSAEGKSP